MCRGPAGKKKVSKDDKYIFSPVRSSQWPHAARRLLGRGVGDFQHEFGQQTLDCWTLDSNRSQRRHDHLLTAAMVCHCYVSNDYSGAEWTLHIWLCFKDGPKLERLSVIRLNWIRYLSNIGLAENFAGCSFHNLIVFKVWSEECIYQLTGSSCVIFSKITVVIKAKCDDEVPWTAFALFGKESGHKYLL